MSIYVNRESASNRAEVEMNIRVAKQAWAVVRERHADLDASTLAAAANALRDLLHEMNGDSRETIDEMILLTPGLWLSADPPA